MGSIMLMKLIEPKMSIAFHSMEKLNPRCYSGKKGAWYFAQWMEKSIIENISKSLFGDNW